MTSDSVENSGTESTVQAPAQDLLLVIFIHGFKGTDSTFGKFPERLQHILTETIANVIVECVVFPAYETKGELNAAVIRFTDWLTDLTVTRENANGLGGGAGKARIVLCGHSMGGLLAADSLIEFAKTRPDQKAPLWPNIIACIAFDTPYLGLHPSVFKNTATQAVGYVKSAQEFFTTASSLWGTKSTTTATTTTTTTTTKAVPGAAITAPPAAGASAWQKWAPAAYAVGGALLAGAAAGTAYYKRQDISMGYTWATDHMKYVGNLWDEESLRRRVDALLRIEEEVGVMFRNFYTCLPPSPPEHISSRTFMVLPHDPSYKLHFLKAPNLIAGNEIEAHTGMFDGKTNDGYYELGLLTAQLIRGMMFASRVAIEEAVNEEKAQKGEKINVIETKNTTDQNTSVAADLLD